MTDHWIYAVGEALKKRSDLQQFIRQQRLPPAFALMAETWFLPLAELLAGHQATAHRPLLVGINGSQGSGKSTLAALLVQLLADLQGLRAINLSMDDFYLPRQARQALAGQVHPLFVTRGVPGTHDVPLMVETLARLTCPNEDVAIPQFDKASDDRVPESGWQHVSAPFDVVIIEGWCLGTPAQDDAALIRPVNPLEADEDPEGHWRRYVNRQIREHYQAFSDLLDIRVMLQAPSFEYVYTWRLEQERKLANRVRDAGDGVAGHIMSGEQTGRFVQHFQRLTEHALAVLPGRVHYLFCLDKNRHIIRREQPVPVRF